MFGGQCDTSTAVHYSWGNQMTLADMKFTQSPICLAGGHRVAHVTFC